MNKDEALVHLSRLALAGRRQDIQRYIARLAKLKEFADIKDELNDVASEAPSLASPMRSNEFEAVPVDTDSRLQLIRVDHNPDIDVAPVWATSVELSLRQILLERHKSKFLIKEGLLPTRSALFVGPPGVGKSLAAKWIASQLDLPLLTLDLSAVMSSFLGRTGSNLRMVLDYAKSTDCVLLLDEIDAVAKRRDDAGEIGELKRLVTVLLQEVDDWPATSLMVAATNHPDLLDPAVWRRFDSIIKFPMPDRSAIKVEIEQVLTTDKSKSDSELTELLSVILDGRSFSDIENVCLKLRKESILTGSPIEKLITDYVVLALSNLDRDEVYNVVAKLNELKYSQRNISEITGVSRDTIRKILRRKEGSDANER